MSHGSEIVGILNLTLYVQYQHHSAYESLKFTIIVIV
jgi:hypothetical protein